MNSMSTHIFEPITDRFGYGKYLDLEIVIDSETKYINATKLCQLGGKRLKKWSENASSQGLLAYYNANIVPGPNSGQVGVSYKIKQEDIKGILKKDQETIVGTYFHEDIIVHIAQWISIEFAIKVSHIVKEYISRENDREIRELRGENKSLLDEIKDLKKQNKKDADDMKETMADMKGMMTDMRGDIRRMRSHLDNAIVSEDKREGIIVYRLDHDDEEVIRIRCGTTTHLNKFANKAGWHREYTAISNAKRALNYLKDNDYITKQTESKYIMPNKDQRSKLLKMLRRVNASYRCT